MKSLHLSLFLILAALFVSCSDDDGNIVYGGSAPEGYSGPITKILEDNVHSIKQNSTIRLRKGEYSYTESFGFHRLFKNLAYNGYEYDRLVGGRVTADILKKYDIYFLNLMDSDRPNFTEGEIDALDEFVFSGGAAFVIVDHSNVYYHADMTNPLLERYGLAVRYETACDEWPATIAGNGWINVMTHAVHPVNEGIDNYCLLTGAPIDGPGGLGFTSENGWGDIWDETNTNSMVGNWQIDEGEFTGPQAVTQAVEYGGGRVFAAGDQNIFGDPALFFLDDYRLAFNAFEWLARRENEELPLRDRHVPGFCLRIDSSVDGMSTFKSWGSNFFTFYFHLNRIEGLNAFSTLKPLPYTPDAFMLVNPTEGISGSSFDEMERVLVRGGSAVLVFDPRHMDQSSADFMNYWELEYGLKTSSGSALDLASMPDVASVSSAYTTIKIDGNTLTLESLPAIKCPGRALLSAKSSGGTECDLVCSYEKDGGRVLLVTSADNFTNISLGGEHDKPEGQKTQNMLLLYGVMDLIINNQ